MREHVESSVELRGALLRLRRATGLPVVFGGCCTRPGAADRRAERRGDAGPARTRDLGGVRPGREVPGAGAAVRGDGLPLGAAHHPRVRRAGVGGGAAVGDRGAGRRAPEGARRAVRALRDALPVGERVFDAAVAAARDVEQALAVRDEVRGLWPRPRRAPPGRRSGRRTANCANWRRGSRTRSCGNGSSRSVAAWRRPPAPPSPPGRDPDPARDGRPGGGGLGRDERDGGHATRAAPGDGEGLPALGDAETGGAHPDGGGGGGAEGGALP